MESPRWEELRDLFARALDTPPAERDAFLAAECADDAMRAELRSLLAAAERAGPLDEMAPRLASLHDVLNDAVPERVGPYEVRGLIDEGGMAVVYRGHDPRLHRDVALKFLPAALQGRSPAANRLMREARAASALDHPNICTIYDIASAGDDRLFIAMAYYRGGTLKDRLRDGPLPVDDVIAIASQVADALDCAHAAGIVHRDVKPANIAFGDRGEVKVLDFGIAVLSDGDGMDAIASAGTPSYMAPEQVLGTGTDRRCDVWALGVVLYEMLTGDRPFRGDTRADVHNRILHTAAPRVSAVRDDVPAALDAVVARALARDPADRFQTAAELRRELLAARPATALPSRRVPLYVQRVAAVAMLLIGIAAAARLRTEAARQEREAATLQDEQLQRARERYFTGTPEGAEAAIAILRSIVDEDSMNAAARSYLAAAYAVSTRPDFARRGQMEWLDSALVHANAAVALAPQDPAAHAALGVVHRWSQRLEQALEHHHQALRLDPRHAHSMLEIGFISHVLGRPDEAAIWLERGLAIEPVAPGARQYAAALYRAFEMEDEAHRHLVAGRTIAPDDPSLIWETVLLAIAGGAEGVAAREFDAYLRLVPSGERERMRAWFEIVRGDPVAARAHIERVDLRDAPSYDLRAFGAALVDAGAIDEGRALLHRALRDIDRNPSTPQWGYNNRHFHTAWIQAALGENEEAISALEQWLAGGGHAPASIFEGRSPFRVLDDDPRFPSLVERSVTAFNERRARVAAELSRLRD